jgi:hypothetical protein
VVLPLTLNPHSYAVLSLSGFSEAFELEQMLLDKVEEFFAKEDGFMLRQRPSVQVRLIEDIDDYEGSIRYLFKPIELKGEYDSATILHGATPETLTKLNSEMKDFLKWFTVAYRMQKMHSYKGVFAGGKNSIGLSTRKLKNRRRADRLERQNEAIRGGAYDRQMSVERCSSKRVSERRRRDRSAECLNSPEEKNAWSRDAYGQTKTVDRIKWISKLRAPN